MSILESIGHELKENPPKILKKTARKKGKKQAEKQRVAILLSKAQKAGVETTREDKINRMKDKLKEN